MSRTDPLRIEDYLTHILEAIARVQEYTSGMDRAVFMSDRKTCDAVIRNLEVVGEACNNIVKNHPHFAGEHGEVPWRFAYEMRNALSHGYFTVDVGIVWQTLQHDLPDLKDQIAALL